MAATSGSSLLAPADQYAGFISYSFIPADWSRYLRQDASIARRPVIFLDARGNSRPMAVSGPPPAGSSTRCRLER